MTQVNLNDDVVRQSLVTLNGELKQPPLSIIISKSELQQLIQLKLHLLIKNKKSKYSVVSQSHKECQYFRRPTDLAEYNYLMALAGATGVLGYYEPLTNLSYLVSSVTCILAIGGLAQQQTAQIDNILVVLELDWVLLALLDLKDSPQNYQLNGHQLLFQDLLLVVQLLPELQSLIYLNQLPASIRCWFSSSLNFYWQLFTCIPHLAEDPAALFHKLSIFFGIFTSGITFTGSLIALAKLQIYCLQIQQLFLITIKQTLHWQPYLCIFINPQSNRQFFCWNDSFVNSNSYQQNFRNYIN
ncbi:unnamed protein product (macronuclear) [Paramecium tetraurelia]|uniref:proton-translocating NAD(P)(+) transhydrogenase n=1 Tax=Paramecium tetraurelia TaxID=5888 RepID=A0BIR5_PARTE|nr:uncharacterized protein GSPATT00004804001 [Paramecium tetraurelia]CAK58432.1 unnamed protein product [Paramecium tetraurelia]|eukprot:XP_001425830.1 hypothetical protein (macronuclear) [Paramecium tetraurelia strain d4-2]